MTITAKIIADSISEHSPRLTTYELRYNRFIHPEFMTHRMFSRNASSSRAIPVEKQIEDILRDTAMPEKWGKNQPGMQAREENDALVDIHEFSAQHREMIFGVTAKEAWYDARDRAIESARAFHKAGYHKQIVNRLLEPFSHITVVCTATDYDNFFALRRHPDAQPEIKILADAMWEAREASTPRVLEYGEWHLPYITEEERSYLNSAENLKYDPEPMGIDTLIRCSVARCARVSYLTHDGKKPSQEADLALYDRLVGSHPMHASPAEHQATPDELFMMDLGMRRPHLHGNLNGWIQYRKTLEGECVTDYVG